MLMVTNSSLCCHGENTDASTLVRLPSWLILTLLEDKLLRVECFCSS